MLAKLRLYYPILLLTAGHGMVDSYNGLLQVLAPGLAAHLNLPLSEVVILIGLSQLCCNLIQPAVGYVMGNRNFAWSLWVAVVVSTLPVFMGYATGIWSLAFLVVVGSSATGLYHPEGAMAAHDASGDKAHLGIPLFMAGGAAIYAAITPLSIRITEKYGFSQLLWFLIPGLATAALFFLSHRKRKREHPSIVIRPRSRRVTVLREGGMSFWPLLAASTFLCVGTGLFLSILSSHFEMRFGSEARQWSGWVLMVMGVGASLSSFLWASLAKRYGFYRTLLLTQLVACPLFLLMAYAPSPLVGFLLSLPLCMVSPAALHPAAITLSKNASGATQALRTSLVMGGTYGVASVAIMAVGVLLRRGMTGSAVVSFVGACSLAAAVIAVWQLIARRKKA